jgi:hypothetical protein
MASAGMGVAQVQMRPDGLIKGGPEEKSARLGQIRAHPLLNAEGSAGPITLDGSATDGNALRRNIFVEVACALS